MFSWKAKLELAFLLVLLVSWITSICVLQNLYAQSVSIKLQCI